MWTNNASTARTMQAAPPPRRSRDSVWRLSAIWRRLNKYKAASTFRRLGKSPHVADLQLIFFCTVAIMLLVFLLVLGSEAFAQWPPSPSWLSYFGGILDDLVTAKPWLLAPTWGAGLVILAWAYQRGSARLGVVDLFACEISTLCRVTTVTAVASYYIQLYDATPSRPIAFPSDEEYAPIFDKNSKDLEALEAAVVRPVTEFYTYLKALRDSLRNLSNIDPRGDAGIWCASMCSVIYMLFLMLESGRHAISTLIDYEPERVSNTISILLNELPAYAKLIRIFEMQSEGSPEEFRGPFARLEALRLRREQYLRKVPEVYWQARYPNYENQNDDDEQQRWRKATVLAESLRWRFRDAFGRDVVAEALPPH